MPSYVLLALPASGTQNLGGVEFPAFGSLSVNSYAVKVSHADGIDFGTATHTVVNDIGMIYN